MSAPTYVDLCEAAGMLDRCHPVRPAVLEQRLRDRGGRPDVTPAEVRGIITAFAEANPTSVAFAGMTTEAIRTYLEVLDDTGDYQLAADAADLVQQAALDLEGWA